MAEELLENELSFGEEFDSQQEFSLIDDSRYEVTLEKLEKRKSKKGNDCINFTFVIRDDVDQNFKKRKVFFNITRKEEPSQDKGVYDFNRVNKLILTQKDTPNYKKNFKTADEVFLYLQGIHLTLEVATEFDSTSGKDRNVVVDYSFAPSEWDKQPKTAPAASTGDFPF